MKIGNNIKRFVNKIIHKTKRMNKRKKLTILSVFTLFAIVALFCLFNHRTITEFVTKITNKADTIEYVPLEITRVQLLTGDLEALTHYEQKDIDDTEIIDIKILMDFKLDSKYLYKDGKWIGQAIYHLPDSISALAEEYEGYIYCDGVKAGRFMVDSENVILTFEEDKLSDGTIIYGSFMVWGSVDFSSADHSSQFDFGIEQPETGEKPESDFYVSLCTKVELEKKALEPTIDEENSTISFNYEVKIYSPGGTAGKQIEFDDIITKTLSTDDNIIRPNIKVEWTDYDGNTKKIPNNTKLFKDGKKKITGTLPPMEPGDSIIVTYSVVEQADSWTNSTFEESNTSKIKVEVDNDEPIELEASTEPKVVEFVGKDYFELMLEKSMVYTDNEYADDYTKFAYEIEISTPLGTKGNKIDLKDNFIMSALFNNNEITIEDFKIYKVKDDIEEEINNDDYLKVLDKLSTEKNPINSDIISGTLPALKENEKYVIRYKVKITNMGDFDYNMSNTAEAKSSILNDSDKVERSNSSSSPERDSMISIKTTKEDDERPKCSSCQTYGISWGGTVTFDVEINNNNSEFKNGDVIDISYYYESDDIQIFLYNPNSNSSYANEYLQFPLTIKKENSKYYIVDKNEKKVQMNSLYDRLKFTITRRSSSNYSVGLELTIESDGETICSEYAVTSVGGSTSCDYDSYYCNHSTYSPPPSTYSPPPSPTPPPSPSQQPYCNYSQYEDMVTKEFVEINEENEEYVTLKWRTKIVPLHGTSFGGKQYRESLSNNSDTYKTHYYTLSQLKNIKVYAHKEDGTDDLFEYGTDYTISAIYCDEVGCNNYNDYSDVSLLTEEKYYTNIKIDFLRESFDLNYEYIYYETQSTGIVGDLTLIRFSSSLENQAVYYDSDCYGFSTARYVYKNLPEVAGDVLQKYNYMDDGTSNKLRNYSYMDDTDKDNIYLYYRVVINQDGTLDGDITYTDILPKGTTFVEDDWSYGGKSCYSYSSGCNNGILLKYTNINSSTSSESSIYYNIDYTYDQETRKLEIKIPQSVYQILDSSSPYFKTLILYYRVRVNEYFERDVDLINNAHLQTSNCDKTDSSTVKVRLQKFHKTFDEFEERTGEIKYHVLVNESGDTVFDGTTMTLVDTITLEDTLTDSDFAGRIKNVGVKEVKLYELVNGEKGPKIGDLDFSTKKVENGIELYMEVPDSKPLYLEYVYKIELFNDYPGLIQFSNSIQILGQDEDWAQDGLDNKSLVTGITIDAFTNSTALSLTKTDINNFDKVLEGATYKLDKYNGSKWLNLGAFTTGKDGSISIGEPSNSGKLIMLYNHAYRVKEVEAPKGYAIDPEYRYIYLANPKLKDEFIPEGFDKENVINKNLGFARVSDEILVLSAEDNPNTRSGNIIAIIVIMVLSSIFMIFAIKKKKDLR